MSNQPTLPWIDARIFFPEELEPQFYEVLFNQLSDDITYLPSVITYEDDGATCELIDAILEVRNETVLRNIQSGISSKSLLSQATRLYRYNDKSNTWRLAVI
jgi:hypothetical protein